MENDFDVGVSYQEDVPSRVISDFLDALKTAGLTVDTKKRSIGVFMTMEWAIPTLVIAYLAKPYFDGFLSEAGKDHYDLREYPKLCV
jgi:hypothetical protein